LLPFSLCVRSEYQEAEAVSALLSKIKIDRNLKDTAILYRTHFQSRVLEEILTSNRVPYRIIGGIHFYARKEIKDMLAYMRLVINPFDRISFFRVINTPLRGLGPKFEQTVLQVWEQQRLFDFKQVLSRTLEDDSLGVSGKKAESVSLFLHTFDGIDANSSPSSVLKHILEQTQYLSFLRTSYDPQDAETKVENVQEFLQSIDEKGNKEGGDSLDDFLQEISLLQEKIDDQDEEDDRVQMMTLHAAKGLEFTNVIMVGLEEGLFPSSRSLYTQEAVEEERRLFYVGVTRAKERLVISHAMYRNTFGQIVDNVQSRFLGEMPSIHIQAQDFAESGIEGAKSFLSRWLHGTPGASFTPTSSYAQPRQAGPIKKKLPAAGSDPWQRNQTVMHKTFGTGVITKVEKKDNTSYYVTAIFRVGPKKVLSDFLTKP